MEVSRQAEAALTEKPRKAPAQPAAERPEGAPPIPPASPERAEEEARLAEAMARIEKVTLTPEDKAVLAGGDAEIANADGMAHAYEAAMNCPAVKD